MSNIHLLYNHEIELLIHQNTQSVLDDLADIIAQNPSLSLQQAYSSLFELDNNSHEENDETNSLSANNEVDDTFINFEKQPVSTDNFEEDDQVEQDEDIEVSSVPEHLQAIGNTTPEKEKEFLVSIGEDPESYTETEDENSLDEVNETILTDAVTVQDVPVDEITDDEKNFVVNITPLEEEETFEDSDEIEEEESDDDNIAAVRSEPIETVENVEEVQVEEERGIFSDDEVTTNEWGLFDTVDHISTNPQQERKNRQVILDDVDE